jgi:hypothetical protein
MLPGFIWLKMGFDNWVLMNLRLSWKAWNCSIKLRLSFFKDSSSTEPEFHEPQFETKTKFVPFGLTKREMLCYALHFICTSLLCECATYFAGSSIFWIHCTRHLTCIISYEYKRTALSHHWSGNDFHNLTHLECLLITSLRSGDWTVDKITNTSNSRTLFTGIHVCYTSISFHLHGIIWYRTIATGNESQNNLPHSHASLTCLVQPHENRSQANVTLLPFTHYEV